jgi:hypothetical protein
MGSETYGGKTIHQWREMMKAPDASKRTEAIMAIMNFSPDSGSAVVSDLVDRLMDTDVGTRAKACLALRYVNLRQSDGQRVIKALAGRIVAGPFPEYESQAIIRYEAAVTLKRFPDAGPMAPKIIRGLQDRTSWEIRQVCAGMLWRLGRDAKDGPDPTIIKAFLEWIPYEHCHFVKLEIVQGLGAMGRPADKLLQVRLVSFLQQATVSNNKALALWAYVALLAQGGDANESKKYLGKVANYLTSQDTDIKVQAAMALGGLGETAKGRVPDILAMLKRDKDKDTVAVQGACAALGRMGDTSDKVIDALLDLLDNKDPARAGWAVKAFVDLKPKDDRVLKSLKAHQANPKIHAGLKGWVDEAIKQLEAMPAGAKK